MKPLFFTHQFFYYVSSKLFIVTIIWIGSAPTNDLVFVSSYLRGGGGALQLGNWPVVPGGHFGGGGGGAVRWKEMW